MGSTQGAVTTTTTTTTTNTSTAEEVSGVGIMTFNLRYAHLDNPDHDGINSWRYRKSHLFELVNKYRPAIMGIQEGLEDQLRDLHQNLDGAFERYGISREENGEYAQIFYDTKVVQHMDGGNFWLSDRADEAGPPAWGAACVRIATWSKFELKTTGQAFFVFNTHFDHMSTVAQEKSAALIRTRIDEIAGSSSIVILTGDFNTYRHSETYDRLKSGLSDAWLTAERQIGHVSYTYHGWKGQGCEDGEPAGKNHIDWIMYQPHHMRVLQTQVITESNQRGLYPSDHYPIYSTFSFPN